VPGVMRAVGVGVSRCFSKPDISRNGHSHCFSRLRPLAMEKARKYLRLNFAEQQCRRPFGQEKAPAEITSVARGSCFLSRRCDWQKAARSSPEIEFRAPFFCNRILRRL
jgi:hypothetical protein